VRRRLLVRAAQPRLVLGVDGVENFALVRVARSREVSTALGVKETEIVHARQQRLPAFFVGAVVEVHHERAELKGAAHFEPRAGAHAVRQPEAKLCRLRVGRAPELVVGPGGAPQHQGFERHRLQHQLVVGVHGSAHGAHLEPGQHPEVCAELPGPEVRLAARGVHRRRVLVHPQELARPRVLELDDIAVLEAVAGVVLERGQNLWVVP